MKKPVLQNVSRGQGRDSEEAIPVEAVMAVNANSRMGTRCVSRNHLWRFAETIHQVVEVSDLVRSRRELGNDGKLVVFYATFLKAFRVIDRILMRDVDDHRYSVIENCGAVLLDKVLRSMLFVDLSHRLHCAKDASNRLGN